MNMNMNNEPQETIFDSKFASRVGDVETVLQEMKGKAEQAFHENDDIMLALYEEVCRVISPIVGKYAARARREELAAMNKNKKQLRVNNRKAKEQAANQNDNASTQA